MEVAEEAMDNALFHSRDLLQSIDSGGPHGGAEIDGADDNRAGDRIGGDKGTDSTPSLCGVHETRIGDRVDGDGDGGVVSPSDPQVDTTSIDTTAVVPSGLVPSATPAYIRGGSMKTCTPELNIPHPTEDRTVADETPSTDETRGVTVEGLQGNAEDCENFWGPKMLGAALSEQVLHIDAACRDAQRTLKNRTVLAELDTLMIVARDAITRSPTGFVGGDWSNMSKLGGRSDDIQWNPTQSELNPTRQKERMGTNPR